MFTETRPGEKMVGPGRYVENVGDKYKIKGMCYYVGRDPRIPRFYFPLSVKDPQRRELRRQGPGNHHHY